MIGTGADPGSERRGAYGVASAVILTVFLLPRLALLYARQPFFDELFSVWISRKPWSGIIHALRSDSGPPLYYLIISIPEHLTGAGGAIVDQVQSVRLLSLLASLIALVLVLGSRFIGPARWIAAILLAFFPAHLYFSGEARAYALCGMFAGVAALALLRWLEDDSAPALVAGAVSLLMAAYAHYYGAILLSMPLLFGLVARQKKKFVEGTFASVVAGALFLPGLWLALHQPREAMRWMMAERRSPLGILGSFARELGFAPPTPEIFMSPPPSWLQWISLVLVTCSVAWGGWRSQRARAMAVFTLTPGLVIAAVAAHLQLYFPFRFESVLAVPFVVWLALSIGEMPRFMRTGLVSVLVIMGGVTSYSMILQNRQRTPDAYRIAGELARQVLPPKSTIVTSGLAYLEVIAQKEEAWNPDVRAYPAEQAAHPGWKVPSTARADLDREAAALPSGFFWVGELASEEQRVLAHSFILRPLYGSGPLVVAVASARHGRDEEGTSKGDPR